MGITLAQTSNNRDSVRREKMEKTIKPLSGRLQGTITAPASKSYAQRALAAALLVPREEGESVLYNMGMSNDTQAALDAIQKLGAKVIAVEDEGKTYRIQGGFLKHLTGELNIGESGLSTRLFTPIAAQSHGEITITGHGSILKRPVSAMEQPLIDLGAEVSWEESKGYLPLTVKGPLKGGRLTVDGSASSQFITGLLMSLPLSEEDTALQVHNPRSVPYIEMTIDVLTAFGVAIGITEHYESFYIAGGQEYRATEYNIEGDWSGASCLLVAGAIAGEITVDNLNPGSLQADKAIIDVLTRAGAHMDYCGNMLTVKRSNLMGFEFDATDCPDLFPALAALAAFCEGKSVIRGTKRLTHKESDRAKTIATEFGKLGVKIDISEENVMIVEGIGNEEGTKLTITDTELDSHNDHRIAMATAVTALRGDKPVTIHSAGAVNKSYPGFWDDLNRLIG